MSVNNLVGEYFSASFDYDKFMLISTPNIFDQGQVIDRQSDSLKPVNRFILGQHICQIISQSETGSYLANKPENELIGTVPKRKVLDRSLESGYFRRGK